MWVRMYVSAFLCGGRVFVGMCVWACVSMCAYMCVCVCVSTYMCVCEWLII